MINITIRQLRYFDAVARFENFGSAAAACHVTQPALSMQIKLLEDQLGFALIDRQSRQTQLNAKGREFARYASQVLQSMHALEEFAQAHNDERMQKLRLGIIPTIAPYILPNLIRSVRGEFNGVELQLRETMTANLLDDLRKNHLDAAILALPLDDPWLETVALFRENFVLARPASQANAPLPRRDQLKEMHWLLLEEGHCFRDQALEVCNLNLSEPREMLDGSSLSTLVQMVASGMGVTLLPEMSVPLECKHAEISITHFDAPRPERIIGMVWNKDNPLRLELANLARLVQSLHQSNALISN